MIVRAVERADRAEWVRMRHGLWPGEDGLEEDVDGWFEGRNPFLAEVLVADRGDRSLGGFIEIGLRAYAEGCATSPVPFVEGLWVDADLRRSGLARSLVAAAETWARAGGHREMASDVLADNQDSLDFHAAAGFDQVETLVCLRKDL